MGNCHNCGRQDHMVINCWAKVRADGTSTANAQQPLRNTRPPNNNNNNNSNNPFRNNPSQQNNNNPFGNNPSQVNLAEANLLSLPPTKPYDIIPDLWNAP